MVQCFRTARQEFAVRMTVMQKRTPAVGIDLGTTNSVVAWLDDLERPQTLVNAEGDKMTPSAVLFDDDLAVVGKEALKGLATEADQVAICAKREFGQRVYSRLLGGRAYPPEVLQAFVLNKLRVDAGRQIGPFHQAVVTVPAYFDEVRRQATMDAGYMAGLEVLDIINEPTAAAVAFGFQQHRMSAHPEAGVRRILVYDLGGGTFDVTVLQFEGTEYTALATDGDVRLGGYDWDQRLVDLVAEQYKQQFATDPRLDPLARGRLWRECEDAKRTLAARSRASIACNHQGQALRVEVTREQFEERTADLLERTKFTVLETLTASGLDWPDIDALLLVGGATRMPAVREMLREVSGKEPDISASPDEAVAHGAAIQAGFLLDRAAGRQSQFRIHNINSHSLGVVGTDPASRQERVAVLIPRNTPLPVSAKRIFKTKSSHQRSILVRVVEGESASAADCVPLGDCVVQDLPANLPAHTPVEVSFAYEQNGRLAVEVHVQGTERHEKLTLLRENSLSREQLDAWRLFVSKVPVPKEEASN